MPLIVFPGCFFGFGEHFLRWFKGWAIVWDAILTCIIKESVPSSAKLGLEDVLFLLIRLNTLSSPALECGITRTSLATVESSGNLGSPTTSYPGMVLLTPSLGTYISAETGCEVIRLRKTWRETTGG